MRTCSRLNRKYSGLSSLDQLQAERDKLEYRLGLKEVDMRRHVTGLRDKFTWTNILEQTLDIFQLSTVASGIQKGFGLVTSLFPGGKKKKKNWLL